MGNICQYSNPQSPCVGLVTIYVNSFARLCTRVVKKNLHGHNFARLSAVFREIYERNLETFYEREFRSFWRNFDIVFMKFV